MTRLSIVMLCIFSISLEARKPVVYELCEEKLLDMSAAREVLIEPRKIEKGPVLIIDISDTEIKYYEKSPERERFLYSVSRRLGLVSPIKYLTKKAKEFHKGSYERKNLNRLLELLDPKSETQKRITKYKGVETSWSRTRDKNTWATNIDTLHMMDILEIELLPIVAKMTTGAHVFELGVGGGHTAAFLAAAGAKNSTHNIHRLTVSDISPFALSAASRVIKPHIRPGNIFKTYLGAGVPYPEAKRYDFLVVNPPYIPSDPADLRVEHDPYRGVGLIKEVIKTAPQVLNRDNKDAAIFMNVSSLAEKDLQRFYAEYSDRVNIERVGPSLKIPLKIYSLLDDEDPAALSWRKFLIEHRGLEYRENAKEGEEPFWHEIKVYKITLKDKKAASGEFHASSAGTLFAKVLEHDFFSLELSRFIKEGVMRDCPKLAEEFLTTIQEGVKGRQVQNKIFKNLKLLINDNLDVFNACYASDNNLRIQRRVKQVDAWLSANGFTETPKSFIDVGSGDGGIASGLAEHWAVPKEKAFGVEVASRGDNPRVEMLQYKRASSIHRIPIDDNQLDFASIMMVLHHAPKIDHKKILSEIRRVLKVGGALMLRESNADSPEQKSFNALMDLLYFKVFNNIDGLPLPMEHNSIQYFQSLAEGLGFEVAIPATNVEAQNPFTPHHILLKKKAWVVPVDEILSMQDGLRQTEESLEGLAAKLAKEKPNPDNIILIRTVDDGKYYIRDGNHHFAAYKMNGVEELIEGVHFVVENYTYKDIMDINFKVGPHGWITPFDPRTHVRVKDLTNYWAAFAEAAEACEASHKNDQPAVDRCKKQFILNNKDMYLVEREKNEDS